MIAKHIPVFLVGFTLLACGTPPEPAPEPTTTALKAARPGWSSACLTLAAFRHFPQTQRVRVRYEFAVGAVGVDFELYADTACLNKSATLSFIDRNEPRPHFILRQYNTRLEVHTEAAREEYARRLRPRPGRAMDFQEPLVVDQLAWDAFSLSTRRVDPDETSRALSVLVTTTVSEVSITAPRADLFSPVLTDDDLDFARRPTIALRYE